ncbi:uncharacterized protein PpBr36_10807, partial [Pyricularia pennisetigena]|uniref:uncharacterized protein n=1 Tax=Pyricularia pennisetigena TaxID=1578925 RepID=UPI00114E4DE3
AIYRTAKTGRTAPGNGENDLAGIMLTRSPAAPHPRSSNASPSFHHTFHYAPASAAAPAPSPPSRLSVPVPLLAKPRHPSLSSSPSPALPASGPLSRTDAPSPAASPAAAPKRYVAVDAGTQYSPMEPINYLATLHAKQNLHIIPDELPPTPGPKPMTPGVEQGAAAAAAAAAATASASAQQPPPSASSGPVPNMAVTVEPKAVTSPAIKRRNSQAVAANSGDAAAQAQNIPQKRAKPMRPPPKVLPQRYELCQVEDIVVLIAHMLGELIETNDALALKSGHLTRFHSRTAPGISVLEYLHRLAKHATLSPPLLLSMVYYIDRLCALYPDFTINTLTVHRFLITAATVAAKGLSDLFWNNTTYARVGGVRVAELKLLELEFLYRVDWKIVPNPDVLVAYYKGLVERCPGYVLQGGEGDQQTGAQVDDEIEDYDDELDDDDDEEEDEEVDDDDASSEDDGAKNGR